MNHLITCICLIILAMSALTSCFDEQYVPADASDLRFTADTLRFDTVFTEVGSDTRSFKIINRSEQNVIIKSVRLEEGSASSFRINVDGIPADDVMEVPVLAGDSIYVFVEVTVDPDAPLSVSPFIITEQLIVEDEKGGRRSMTLEAWGQNANYFPSRNAAGQIIGLTCEGGNVVWNDPKPYVIYGLLFIDDCNLLIAPGTDIYFHGGLARLDGTIYSDGGLFFSDGATLQVLGTEDRPVTFQSDRLEDYFANQPGQWAGLRFLSESKNNIINHARIRNSAVGIRVDSAAQVAISNTSISNTSDVGLIAISADVTIDNSIIHSNATQSMACIGGGDYRVRYTTIANYENQAPALYMDNFICTVQDCSEAWINPLNATFENCIISGSNKDELNMTDYTGGSIPEVFNVHFDHTIIRVDELKGVFDFDLLCDACYEHTTEPLFVDQDVDIYQLDSLSIALDKGKPLSDLPLDINGHMRSMTTPDLGCYESDR